MQITLNEGLQFARAHYPLGFMIQENLDHIRLSYLEAYMLLAPWNKQVFLKSPIHIRSMGSLILHGKSNYITNYACRSKSCCHRTILGILVNKDLNGVVGF